MRHFVVFHWRKFAWGGSGIAISTLGTQIDKPYSTACYVAACVCAIIAANDRANQRGDKNANT